MFGSGGGFGGFGGAQNNQQNQQQGQAGQQAGGNAWGAPQQPAAGGFGGGFGAAQPTNTFGAPQGSSLFGGAPAAQQQPTTPGSTGFSFGGAAQPAGANTANTFGQQPKPAGFGGFGAQPAASTGGFGGFGASTQQQTPFGASTGGAFGAKPAAGGLFGQPPTGPSGFGQPQQGGGLFGAAPGNSLQAVPTQGSSNPPYQVHNTTEADANGANKHDYAYQSITTMPAYRSLSIEEIRVQDYQQGRKTGNQGPGAGLAGFGQQQPQQQQGGLFGQQQQQQPTTGLFGQPAQQPAAGGFGQQPATGGLFGQQQQQQQPQQGGGLFGASNTASTSGGGLFGAQQQQQPTTGLFGQQQQQPQQNTGFSFGGQPATSQAPATGGFSFAQTPAQAKPATSLFGGGGGFGQPAAQPAAGGFGSGFGQQQQQAQQPAAGGFGGGASGFSFGGGAAAAPKPGLFGQPAAQQPASTGFGAFGAASSAASTAPKPAFSFSNGAGAAPATSGGLFGNSAPAPTSQPAGGLFGGGFGQQQQQQQQQPALGNAFGGGGGGLFGQKPAATTGLFGQQPQQQQQPTTGFGASSGGGLFGTQANKPATGGLFGGGAQSQPAGGLFGGQQSTLGGGTGGGLFGQSQAQQPGASTGLFGQSQPAQGGGFGQASQAAQQQPNFTASLQSADPYGTEALFNAAGQSVSGAANGKPPIPFDVSLARSTAAHTTANAARGKTPIPPPFRPSPRAANKIVRLRGATPAFGTPGARESTPVREGTPGGSLFGLSANRGASPSVSLFRGLSDEQARGESLPAQAFVQRPSVKRLVLGSDASNAGDTSRSLFARSGSAAPLGSAAEKRTQAVDNFTRGHSIMPQPAQRITFDPSFESSSRAKQTQKRPAEADESQLTQQTDASFSKSSVFDSSGRRAAEESPSRPPAQRTVASLPEKPAQHQQQQEKEEELPLGYFITPSLAELSTWSAGDLASVPGFVVGRPGYGTVCFLEPVDLTGLDLHDIAGGVVQIRARECFVYPDDGDCYDAATGDLLDGVKPGFDTQGIEKAARGQGLNVPALVMLEKCWPLDRATRQPIKDAENARVKQHVAKLKRQEETSFEAYDAKTGTWKFRVEHFSRYGLDDSDDEEDAAVAAVAKRPTAAAVRKAAAEARARKGKGDAPPSRALVDEDASTEEESADEEDSRMRVDDLGTAPKPRFGGARANAQRESSGSPAPASFAATLGLEARRVQVMQASFFGQGPTLASKERNVDGGVGSFVAAQARKHARASLPGATQAAESGTNASRPTFAEPAQKLVVAPALEPMHVEEEAPAPLTGAPRKFTRTDAARSAVAGAEGIVVDAGLALGRSFRVGWGPNGTIAHVGKLLSGAPKSAGGADVAAPSASSVRLEKLKLSVEPVTEETPNATLRLLELHFKHSAVENSIQQAGESIDSFDPQPLGCPQAFILPETRFRNFAAAFDANDRRHEALLWRLGVALFDELELRLPEEASRELVHKATVIRRKAALSAWLADAVAGTVETESRAHVAAGREAALVFAYLSGNQLERACHAAIEAGDVRLATLLAQAGSGDDEVRADIAEQLHQWRLQGVDAHIQQDHRRIYEVLAGNVTFSEGTAASRSLRDPVDAVKDLQIAAGLDWKRALGLHLWYDTPHDSASTHAVERYEAAVGGQGGTAPPLPPYLESSQLGSLRLGQLVASGTYDRDALYELIKLFAQPSYALQSALKPRGFGAATADYRLSWHTYQLLSRALKVRDFEDRIELGVELAAVAHLTGETGNSATADMLTTNYAHQLELQGHWTWAAFVLLHLELETSREKAVRALIVRNVHRLDEPGTFKFLTQKLHIPEPWLWEAKAFEARSRDDRYNEYRHFLSADMLVEAHAVAVRYLAPEAMVRSDLRLLINLFAPFSAWSGAGGFETLPGWLQGGKLYGDYAACMTNLPGLVATYEASGLAEEEQHKIRRLAHRVPELLKQLPALFPDADSVLSQAVARELMVQNLRNLARSLAVSNLAVPQSEITLWDTVPEILSLQNAANDYCSLLVGAQVLAR